MEKRRLIEQEIKEYCQLNNIDDVDVFITQCIIKGFNIFKYGTCPADNVKRQNGSASEDVSGQENKISGMKENIPVQDKTIVRKKRKITVVNIN